MLFGHLQGPLFRFHILKGFKALEVIAQMRDREGPAEPLPAHLLGFRLPVQGLKHSDAAVVPLPIRKTCGFFRGSIEDL